MDTEDALHEQRVANKKTSAFCTSGGGGLLERGDWGQDREIEGHGGDPADDQQDQRRPTLRVPPPGIHRWLGMRGIRCIQPFPTSLLVTVETPGDG